MREPSPRGTGGAGPGRLRLFLLTLLAVTLSAGVTTVPAALAADPTDGSVTAVATDPPPHRVEHVRVPSHDGVELDGWIVRPTNVAAEATLPVVLWSAPYFGQCNYYPFVMTNPNKPGPQCDYATGDDPELWDNSNHAEAVPVNFLLAHGYAVAIFNVRGTGNSGGCFSWIGKDEQRDQAFLVEWLADLGWSNGRVGMMGLSYHGTTPWEAAIQNPPSLKTIVVAGMIGDAYTFSHTPQGATMSTIGAFDNNFVVRVSLSPPINGTPQHATVDHVPAVAERLCPDLAKFMTEDAKGLSDIRDAAFWAERRLIDRFPQITTAVLLTHGFQDLWLSGHQQQEQEVWNLLANAPKRMLEGQWGHDFPNYNTTGNGVPVMKDWNQRLLAWLDHWLKDPRGKAPREGRVDYQDSTQAWHSSSAWPPADAREEVLYLTGGTVSPRPGSRSGTFRSYPQWEKLATPEHLLCDANLQSDVLGPGNLTFISEPLTQPVLIAGNPMAHLRLSSDQPGGLAAVHLYDLAPDFTCSAGFASGARKLGYGAADLRFHKGNMLGESFPVGEATPVRIDVTSMAERLAPGHRLGVAVSYGDWLERTGQPWLPQLTVHADGAAEATHLVLPLVKGSLGGAAPRLAYAPRPFLPNIPARPEPAAAPPDQTSADVQRPARGLPATGGLAAAAAGWALLITGIALGRRRG